MCIPNQGSIPIKKNGSFHSGVIENLFRGSGCSTYLANHDASGDVGELSGAEIVAGALERNRTGAILVYTSLSSRVTAFSDAAERERRSA